MARKYLDSTLHPEKLVIDTTHYAGLKRHRGEGMRKRLDEAFLKRFPTLAPMVDVLIISDFDRYFRSEIYHFSL